MASTDYFTRKTSVGRVRTPVAPSAPAGSSPTTPISPFLGRSFSSALNSPSASFRSSDDEPLLVEIGSRYLRAGLAGERTPRCILDFSPNEQRRVGDYRQWLSEGPHADDLFARRPKTSWGRDHELWRMNLSHVDLALVEDKLERAFRLASTKYLMETSQKPRRILLALPPTLPHPLLSSVLTILFNKAQAPTITIFPTPLLNTVAAGLRSALVVDIGWAETIITGVYEYRELLQKRSDRAAKTLCLEFGALLEGELERRLDVKGEDNVSDHGPNGITFEQSEEVMTRIGWCQNAHKTHEPCRGQVPEADGAEAAENATNSSVHIPIRTDQPIEMLDLPFHRLAEPVEMAWLGKHTAPKELDENEQPLQELAFQVLRALPVDVRAVCMSRIIVTGGGSQLPGIKRRLVKEIGHLAQTRGWDPVRNLGSAADRRPRTQPLARAQLQSQPDVEPMSKINGNDEDTGVGTISSSDPSTMATVAAQHTDQEHDPIASKLSRERVKVMKPSAHGFIRGVETMGAFSGLSILASTPLHVRGVVECERDTFLLHGGLASASKAKDVFTSQTSQRQSLGPSTGGGNRNSWTLGSWG